MTSNAGAQELAKGGLGFTRNEHADRKGGSLKAIERLFSPEFRNRLDAIIPFGALNRDIMLRVVSPLGRSTATSCCAWWTST